MTKEGNFPVATSKADVSTMFSMLSRNNAERFRLLETVEDLSDHIDAPMEMLKQCSHSCLILGDSPKNALFYICLSEGGDHWRYVTNNDDVLGLLTGSTQSVGGKVEIQCIPYITKIEDMRGLKDARHYGHVEHTMHKISKEPQA